jgi:hypothetical protein
MLSHLKKKIENFLILLSLLSAGLFMYAIQYIIVLSMGNINNASDAITEIISILLGATFARINYVVSSNFLYKKIGFGRENNKTELR